MLEPGCVGNENTEGPPNVLGLVPERPKEKGAGERIEFGFSTELLLKNENLSFVSPAFLVDVMFNGIVVLLASFFVISIN